MFKEHPYYKQFQEKPHGEGWLVNQQEGLLVQIRPDSPTQHAQFVLVSTYRRSSRLGQPIRRQRMLTYLGI